MSQMLKSSGATAAATMLSRVLGLVREMAYAAFMGQGWVADAFLFAFQIPNLFRRLLGEGALTAAFIPLFKQKEKLAGEEAMWHSANAVISGLLVVATAISVVAAVVVTAVLAWGRIEDGGTLLMLRLFRVMLPYILLVCLAAVFMGILNARGYFFVPALGAAMLNVALIASVFWIAPHMGVTLPQQIYGLAIGVLIAGFVQAAFQVPLLRRGGFRYRWVTPWRDPTVREVVRRMLPATVGVAAFQVNVLIATGFAFIVGKGIVSAFNYAVRLMELPQGVFGISLATYLLPALSGLAAEKKYPEFRATLRDGIGYILFVNALASVFLFVLAEPIIRLLFERRAFTSEATMDVAVALRAIAPGLVAFSLVNILGRAFYALGDTTTPMRISVFCLVLNAVITLPLVWLIKQAGLGVANTVTGFINLGLLFFALRKKMKTLELASVQKQVWRIMGVALFAGVVAWQLYVIWDRYFGHASFGRKLTAVFGPMAIGTACYFALALALRIPMARELARTFRRARQARD